MAEENQYGDPRDFFDPEKFKEPLPSEREAAGESDLLPPGDYLVVVDKVSPRVRHGKDRSWKQANFQLRVVEPVEYKDRTIFHSVDLFSAGEHDFVRMRRYRTLISMRVVSAGDQKAIIGYNWARAQGYKFVFRAGHRQYWSDKHSKVMTALAPYDEVGLHSEAWWNNEEAKPAPQDWEIDKSQLKGIDPALLAGEAKSEDAVEVPDEDVPDDV